MNVSVLIPTLNAGSKFDQVLKSINSQSIAIKQKIIIDSGSNDNTKNLAKISGFEVIEINKKDFQHGVTRQQLVDLSKECEICIFLTQDAILASINSIENLVGSFVEDAKVSLAYGRQLPNIGAKVLESHARFFNYPFTSSVRTLVDRKSLGFKTIFCSDSFAAYRKSVLNNLGGFPSDTIMGEDTIVASKMLLAGYRIAYVSTATVYHSHSYTLAEEFKRYFDTGVFHAKNMKLKEEFGTVSGEGFKFFKSELKYVLKNKAILLPYSVLSTIFKWVGYKMGVNYKMFNKVTIRAMSMHKSYWDGINLEP